MEKKIKNSVAAYSSPAVETMEFILENAILTESGGNAGGIIGGDGNEMDE